MTNVRSAPALARDLLTPLYDVATALVGFGGPFRDGVARLADVRAGADVLDLGCGTGTLLQALVARQPAARYVGVDPDPRMLRLAGRRLGEHADQVDLVQGSGTDLCFGPNAFDVVVSTLVFHHLALEAKTAVLQEVARVLRPDGRFLLVDFGPPRTALARAVLTGGSLVDGRHGMAANLAGRLPALLEAAGFDTAEIRRPYREVRFLLARPHLP